jgi:hypothetical protein
MVGSFGARLETFRGSLGSYLVKAPSTSMETAQNLNLGKPTHSERSERSRLLRPCRCGASHYLE